MQDILFMQGSTLNIKWDNFLKRIKNDPEKFFEEGGWEPFFIDSEDDEDENEDD